MNFGYLDSLVTDGFDIHQVWEQIQLLNSPAVEHFTTLYQNANIPEDAEEGLESGDESEQSISDGEMEHEMEADEKYEEFGNEEDEILEEDLGNEDDEMPEEYEEDLSDSEKPAKKIRRSVVDDDFFSLEEMERFADMGEKQDIKMANMDPNSDSDEDDDEDIFSIGKDLARNDFEDEDNANGRNF